MVIYEEDIRDRINHLEHQLKDNVALYSIVSDDSLKRRLLMQSFNIESQLQGLYYTLGVEYKYKYLKDNNYEIL